MSRKSIESSSSWSRRGTSFFTWVKSSAEEVTLIIDVRLAAAGNHTVQRLAPLHAPERGRRRVRADDVDLLGDDARPLQRRLNEPHVTLGVGKNEVRRVRVHMIAHDLAV